MDEIVVTNTVPLPHTFGVSKVKQLSLGPLVAQVIYTLTIRESLSESLHARA